MKQERIDVKFIKILRNNNEEKTKFFFSFNKEKLYLELILSFFFS